MSLESIVSARLFQWRNACEAWGFEIQPPFTANVLRDLAPGEVRFRATPDAWLHAVNLTLGGLLDDGFQDWWKLADEED